MCDKDYPEKFMSKFLKDLIEDGTLPPIEHITTKDLERIVEVIKNTEVKE